VYKNVKNVKFCKNVLQNEKSIVRIEATKRDNAVECMELHFGQLEKL
jgi:hypothetical protein